MIKTCHTCQHTGELTWRDGKYYCAMCGSEISEKQPEAQPQRAATVNNVSCPICKNRENNLFDGTKYRCSLCGTPFDWRPEEPVFTNRQQSSGSTFAYAQTLKEKKKKHLTWGIVCVFFFWPASIYFFYKAYQLNKELEILGY